jgi:hypothetical protein
MCARPKQQPKGNPFSGTYARGASERKTGGKEAIQASKKDAPGGQPRGCSGSGMKVKTMGPPPTFRWRAGEPGRLYRGRSHATLAFIQSIRFRAGNDDPRASLSKEADT